MITRKDSLVAGVAILTTATVIAFAQSATKPAMHSSIFNWKDLKAETTKTGERREVFDSTTATLAQLEMHITTLNPGESPHPAHHHPEEELMIVKEGTIEEVLNGVTNRVEAGGIIFAASEEMHGMRNIGTNRATYYVVKIYPHDLPKPRPQ